MASPVCVVAGVGPGNGEALARRFAREGRSVALLARSEDFTSSLADELGASARAYSCDLTDPGAVARNFYRIRSDLGPVDVLCYNAGAGVWGSVDEVEPDQFELAWRSHAQGLVLTARAVMGDMKARGSGAIIVTGATASLRGKAATAPIAAAKAAQRSIAQSLARQLWPHGVHVALIIIDGTVDLPATREAMPDKPDEYFVQPSAVADTAWWLTRQDRSGWSFEVEARPFGENW